MTDLISHPIASTRVLLSWQAPLDSGKARNRRAVGELRRIPGANAATFRYLADGEDFAPAQAAGFSGYPSISFEAGKEVSDAEQVFARRLPPASRSDFGDYLRRFGLDPAYNWSAMDVLAYTGGRLPSDSFGFAETFDGFDRPFKYVFDVAGFRHYQNALPDLAVGNRVEFLPQPANPHDANAVEVRVKGALLGHINRLQAARVRQWAVGDQISGRIHKINGRSEYPRLFLMADIEPNRSIAAA